MTSGLKLVLGIVAALLFAHWYLWHQWRTGRLQVGWRVWQRALRGARDPLSHWKDEQAQMQTLREQVQALQARESRQGEASHE